MYVCFFFFFICSITIIIFYRIPRSVQFSRLLEKNQEKHVRSARKNSSESLNQLSNNHDKAFFSRSPPTTTMTMPCRYYHSPVTTLLIAVLLVHVTGSAAHGYDVFLGGSCNPTTWRKDVAIPYLQDAGVSFYNPVSKPCTLCAAAPSPPVPSFLDIGKSITMESKLPLSGIMYYAVFAVHVFNRDPNTVRLSVGTMGATRGGGG